MLVVIMGSCLDNMEQAAQEYHFGNTRAFPEHMRSPKQILAKADGIIRQSMVSPLVLVTNSELVRLRIQRRIREGTLEAHMVQFVEATEDGIAEIRIDEQGEFLDEWAEMSFEEGYTEVMAKEPLLPL